jgi:hypothetical protein
MNNGIPQISDSARKWRINGYTDGRAGRRPRRTGMDYADGYRAGMAMRSRVLAIQLAAPRQAYVG